MYERTYSGSFYIRKLGTVRYYWTRYDAIVGKGRDTIPQYGKCTVRLSWKLSENGFLL